MITFCLFFEEIFIDLINYNVFWFCITEIEQTFGDLVRNSQQCNKLLLWIVEQKNNYESRAKFQNFVVVL